MSRTTITDQPEQAKQFEATIKVAGLKVAPSVMPGGKHLAVAIHDGGTQLFTPAEACALAAALQSVAVFQMEQSEEAVA